MANLPYNKYRRVKTMNKCPYCKTDKINKNGKTLKGIQRYQCKECKKHFIDTHGTVYYGRKLDYELIDQVVKAHCEGNGIRALNRIFGTARDTVSDIIQKAGNHAQKVNAEIMQDLPCNELQLDEMWAFVKKT
jgi:transposase-like protein